MDDVRRDFLGPLDGTTPTAVIANTIKLKSFKSSEQINEKMDGPYHDFGYLSFFSDPLDLARINTVHNFTTFNRVGDRKTSIIQTEPNA